MVVDDKNFKSINDSIANLQTLIESNKESTAKVLMYLVNKNTEIEEKIANIYDEITKINTAISENDQTNQVKELTENVSKIETTITEIKQQKDTEFANTKEELAKAKDASQQLITEANKLQQYFDKNKLDKDQYFIIDKKSLTWPWLEKTKDKLYVIFHYRKIKKQQEEELLRQKQIEEEKRRIEEENKLAKQIKIEEDKRKNEEEIRKILQGYTKK